MKNLYKFPSNLTHLILLMLLIQIIKVNAQNHPLLDSDHIPLMGLHHSAWHEASKKILFYPKLKEMGLEGVIFGDVSDSMITAFDGLNDQMKLIPAQTHFDVNYIEEYTSAIYTIWQAHDTTFSPLKAALQFNGLIGQRVSGGNTIRTKPNAEEGRLISGPGYNQRVKYASDRYWNPPHIEYRASFNIKIERNIIHPDPPIETEGLTDTLCILKVVVKEIGYENGFYFKDSLDWAIREVLVNELEFDEWKKFDINYTYANLPGNFKFIADSTERTAQENDYAEYVEFYIEWKGVDYTRLYFDTLLVSDERGRNLFGSNEEYRDQVRNQANNTGNGQGFNVSTVFFENTVAGFYGQDEPGSIDNLEPFRIVNSLVQSQNSNLHLYTTYATGWGGIYGMPWPDRFEDNGWVYRGTEFIKRSKLPIGSINNYMYIELRNEKTFYVK